MQFVEVCEVALGMDRSTDRPNREETKTTKYSRLGNAESFQFLIRDDNPFCAPTFAATVASKNQ